MEKQQITLYTTNRAKQALRLSACYRNKSQGELFTEIIEFWLKYHRIEDEN